MEQVTLTGKDHFLRCIILCFGVLYIIDYFLVVPALQYIGCVLLLILFVKRFRQLPVVNLLVVSGMLVIGTVVLIASGVSWRSWVESLMQNASLVVLFTAAPMMSMPFFFDDYQTQLKYIAQTRMRSLLAFTVFFTFSTHVLSLLIGMGAVIVLYDILHPYGKLYKSDDIFLSTLTRANCSSGFWSPAWASMMVVTSNLPIPWISTIPIGIVFSLVFMALHIGSVGLRVHRNPQQYPSLTPDSDTCVDSRKVRTLLVLVGTLIGGIILISAITNWNLMVIVSLVAVGYPLLCARIQGKMPAYKQGLAKYYRVSLVKASNEIMLFSAAGFLGKALQLSGIGERIPAILPKALFSYPLLLCAAIMAIMILPSLIGIHPVATGTALVTSLVPASLGMGDMTFALTILTGWALTIMMSPFSGIALILSGSTGRAPWAITLKGNGRFGLVCLVVFSVLITLVGPLL